MTDDLSLKPDDIDMRILSELMKDGRASMRQIAQRTSLTTPTVSSRYARMMKAGLIKRFVPLLSPDSVDRGVLVLVILKVNPAAAGKVAGDLARLPAVDEVYAITGQNIALKATLDSIQDLDPFLKRHALGRSGVELVSSQIVTSVVKEEPPSLLTGGLTMNLKCDYCHGEVTSSRPYTVVVASSHYYFCCKTCRRDYLEKHGTRLEKIRRSQATRTLRS